MDTLLTTQVAVNWFYNSADKYVPDYYEWREDDDRELIIQCPLFYVTKEVYVHVTETNNKVPDELYRRVAESGAVIQRKNEKGKKKHERVNDIFVITDGEQTMAVLLDDRNVPLLKSRLLFGKDHLIRHEIRKYSSKGVLPESFELPEQEERKEEPLSVMDKIYTVTPEHFYGLTRTERELKNTTLECFREIASSEERRQLAYFYIFLYPVTYKEAAEYPLDDLIEGIYSFIVNGWSNKHLELGKEMAKYLGVFDEMFKDLEDRIKKELQH